MYLRDILDPGDIEKSALSIAKTFARKSSLPLNSVSGYWEDEETFVLLIGKNPSPGTFGTSGLMSELGKLPGVESVSLPNFKFSRNSNITTIYICLESVSKLSAHESLELLRETRSQIRRLSSLSARVGVPFKIYCTSPDSITIEVGKHPGSDRFISSSTFDLLERSLNRLGGENEHMGSPYLSSWSFDFDISGVLK